MMDDERQGAWGSSGAPGRRAGVTFGDVVLAFAIAGMVAAVLAPGWGERRADRALEAVVAEVESVRIRAEAARQASGDWPSEVEVGDDTPGAAPSLSLVWRRMTSVDVPDPPAGPVAPGEAASVEPPPPIPPRYFRQGTLSILGADDAVFAALLARYPQSFVHGKSWTLLLPRVEIPAP